CFRIHRQMRPPDYSQLLCDRAKNCLYEAIRLTFSDLPIVAGSDALQSERTNAHPTNTDYITQRFGIPCMAKVFHYFVDLGRGTKPKSPAYVQQKNADLILRLILEALNYGGSAFT